MNKESIFELQKIDCNCNDCKFMERDLAQFKLWSGYTEHLQYVTFLRKRRKELLSASELIYGSKRKPNPNSNTQKQGKVLESSARKMKFQFDRAQLTVQYGHCTKFSKPVTFIPVTCQLDTQDCFEHRRG